MTLLIKGDVFDDLSNTDIKSIYPSNPSLCRVDVVSVLNEDPKDCVSWPFVVSGGADPLNIIKVGLRIDVKLFSAADCVHC